MINIGILSEDKIITLKNNEDVVAENIKTNNENIWLKDFFREENPFQKSKAYRTEFTLLKAGKEDEVNRYDLENAIALYEGLKITDAQAADERLWISLCFGEFYDYMRSRWTMEKKTTLKEHWFYPHGQKRSLYYNGISRLYWCVKISYDASLEDPYALTRFCFKDINIITQMIFRGYANSKTVRLALLKALKTYVETGGGYNRALLLDILKYVSFLGGAYILDCFTEKELFDKILKKLKDYSQEKEEKKPFGL